MVALGFGTVVLAANFTREYVALGGEVASAELPSVESMFRRTGLSWNSEDRDLLGWPAVTARQLKRAGLAPIPYAVSYFISDGVARVHTGWAMKRSTSEGDRFDVIWEGSFSPGSSSDIPVP